MVEASVERGMIKFDGKHWIGKRVVKGPLKADYTNVARQAQKNLGYGGIVAVPNARPDEYRFEEFMTKGEESGIRYENDEKKFFYDLTNKIYFIKAQEVRTEIDGVPVVVLAYNLPFGINLNEKNGNKTLEEATKYNCILGLNIPSCFDEVDNHWLSLLPSMGNFDFVVGYAGGAALKGFGSANFMAQKIYEEDIKDKEFENQYTEETHKI